MGGPISAPISDMGTPELMLWCAAAAVAAQAAAGMGIYGPRTVFCLAVGGYPGCHEFLLMDDGKWVHVKETTGGDSGSILNFNLNSYSNLGFGLKCRNALHLSKACCRQAVTAYGVLVPRQHQLQVDILNNSRSRSSRRFRQCQTVRIANCRVC